MESLVACSPATCVPIAPASIFFFWPRRFHCPDREWTRGSDVRLPVHEGDQLSAPEYRNRLYQVLGAVDSHRPLSTDTLDPSMVPGHCSDPSIVRPPLSAPPIPQMILERMGNHRSPRGEGLEVVASRAELRVSSARTQSLKPGVLPQVPAETPARKRGPKPQSSPGHDPEHVGELYLSPTHPWPLLCRATNVCSSGDLTPGVALTTPQKFAGRAQTPCSNFRRQAGGKGPQGPQGSHPQHPQG